MRERSLVPPKSSMSGTGSWENILVEGATRVAYQSPNRAPDLCGLTECKISQERLGPHQTSILKSSCLPGPAWESPFEARGKSMDFGVKQDFNPSSNRNHVTIRRKFNLYFFKMELLLISQVSWLFLLRTKVR